MQVNKNQTALPSEHKKHSKTATLMRTKENTSAPKQYISVQRAARGLVQMKYWCCDACMNFQVTKVLAFGLPSMVPSVPTAQLSSAVKPFFAALKPTLLAKDGTIGRLIRRPIPVRSGVRLIGQASSGQKRGIHDGMLIIHRIEPLLNMHHDEHRIKKKVNMQYNFAPKMGSTTLRRNLGGVMQLWIMRRNSTSRRHADPAHHLCRCNENNHDPEKTILASTIQATTIFAMHGNHTIPCMEYKFVTNSCMNNCNDYSNHCYIHNSETTQQAAEESTQQTLDVNKSNFCNNFYIHTSFSLLFLAQI